MSSKKKLISKLMSICFALMLLFMAALQNIALADPGEGTQPAETLPPAETPAPVPTPTPTPEPTPEPTPAPTPRPFPRWMLETPDWPIWIYTVDEFPDWFYELEREPVWFREIEAVPSWFYILTEIPDWFYPDPNAPVEVERELPQWLLEIVVWPMWFINLDEYPDWFYDLESEPAWFREVDEVPPWFYNLTEIPDWFYPDDESEDPEVPDEPEETYYPPGFDTGEKLYTRDLGNNMILYSNIPNGMITNDDVLIDFPVEYYVLLLDEVSVPFLFGEPLTEHGLYTLVQIDNPAVMVYSFMIVKRPVNYIFEYALPAGFEITSLYLGETALTVNTPGRIETDSEGTYVCTLFETQSGDVFTVQITYDITPPALVFTNGAEHEEELALYEISPEGTDELLAPIAYYVADDEEGCIIEVTLNGTSINPRNSTLLESGLYRVTVRDEAGNSTLYTFRILYVMNIPTVWVIVIISLAIAGLTAYLIRYRMTVKVR